MSAPRPTTKSLLQQWHEELLDELYAENPWASDAELEAKAVALKQAAADQHAEEWGVWHTDWDDVMPTGRGG